MYKALPDGSPAIGYTCSIGDIGDEGLIPGLRRSPRGGNGNPLPAFLLEKSLGSQTGSSVCGVTKSQTAEHAQAQANSYPWYRSSDFNKKFAVESPPHPAPRPRHPPYPWTQPGSPDYPSREVLSSRFLLASTLSHRLATSASETNAEEKVGTSLVVQWLRLHAPNARVPGSIPG